MDSIKEYIAQLKSELKNLKTDQVLAEEYSLHLQAEFDDFKARKSTNIASDQLEKIFVTQLEEPKIIAQSLAGIESINEIHLGDDINSFSKSLKLIAKNTSISVRNTTKKLFSRLKIYYEFHESPLFTAMTIVSISTGISLIIDLLFIILFHFSWFEPPYGQQQSGDYFYLIIAFLFVPSTILIPVIIIILGWKYDLIYSLKTILYITFFMTPILVYLQVSGILDFILVNRNFSPVYVRGLITGDWMFSLLPNVNGFTNIFPSEAIYAVFLYILIIQTLLMVISYIIKLIKINNFSLKKIKTRPALIGALVILFFSLVYLITFPLINPYPTSTQLIYMPPPTPFESPLIYEFTLSNNFANTTSTKSVSVEGMGTINVTIPSGNIYYFVHVTSFLYSTNNILARGCYLEYNFQKSFNGQNNILNNTEPCSNLGSPVHNLLGILYLPVNNFSLYNNLLNTTYPFSGYEPSVNTDQQTVVWPVTYDDKSKVNLPIFTLEYRSATNNSVFTFLFDRTTGWLMNATLKLDNRSWVPGSNYNILTITRVFLFQTTDKQSYFDEFYNTFNMLMIVVTGTNWGIIIAVLVYNKRFKHI